MPLEQAQRSIDLTFQRTPESETIDFAFFGGEPLMEFPEIRAITEYIESHPDYHPKKVQLTIVTNGTIFNSEISGFVREHRIAFGISCDGPPEVHDRFRVYPGGKGSSRRVSQTILKAVGEFSQVMVNAVYRPETIDALPETVDYFSDLGVRQIYLSPDYSAPWTASDSGRLDMAYGEVGEKYMKYYRQRDPHFISLIDSKIAVILRGGYQQGERCSMGKSELAFAPDGSIYPCERLVGKGDNEHRIGNIKQGIEVKLMSRYQADKTVNTISVCQRCRLNNLCMNWCGCSNFFSSGYYNSVSPFLCASERASIRTALNVYETLEKEMSGAFLHHLNGSPLINSVQCRQQT